MFTKSRPAESRSREHLVADIAVGVLECRSWPDAAAYLLEGLMPEFGASMGLVLEAIPDADRLRVVAAAGWEGSEPGATLALVPGSVFERALNAPGKVIVEPRRVPGPAEASYLPQFGAIASSAVVAFDAGAGRRGILGVFEVEPRVLSRDEDELLSALGALAGGAARRSVADAGVRETEERLRLAQAAGRMGTFAWDISAGRVEWSETLQILHGLAPGSFDGTFQAFISDIHPDDLPRVLATIEHSLEIGTHEVEYRIVVPSGKTLWISARGQVLYDASGKPSRVVGICMDVTERRRAEDALHLLADAATELAGSLDYETTLRNIAGLLVPRLADWCVIDIASEDGSIEHVAGLHRDPARLLLMQEHLAATISPEEAPRDLVHTLQSGKSVMFPEVTGEMFARSRLDPARLDRMHRLGTGSAMIVPIRARNRTIGALTLVIMPGGNHYDDADLALAEHIGRRAGLSVDNARLYQEARRIEAELRRASEAKDEFLGLMSHELRTPITVLSGGARLLRARGASLSAAEYDQVLTDLEGESDRLFRMVENLLALARAELEGAIQADPVLVQRVLDRALKSISARLTGREIIANVDAALPPVAGHEGYIEHILRNLVGNAHKYSANREPITVIAREADGGVEVIVADRGPGLDEDEAEVIFDRFYRSERTSGLVGGAGLGLAVCKRLIDTMGGAIWARPRQGGGLEVGFRLDLYDTFEEAV